MKLVDRLLSIMSRGWKTHESILLTPLVCPGYSHSGDCSDRLVVDGCKLEFQASPDGEIIDRQTGSVWSITGEAVSGPLKGRRLDPLATEIHFAFAWLVFRPETIIFQ